VLDPVEAPRHPHHQARGTFVELGGVLQPGPAPRYSVTAAQVSGPAHHAGADTDAVLRRAGFADADIAALRGGGAVA